MTDEEILKKVVKKAIKGGWENHYETLMAPTADKEWLEKYLIASQEYRLFIFSHDFAKAFFGEHPHYFLFAGQRDTEAERRSRGQRRPAWQHHLQQMVLEEKPILYLKKFL